MPANVTQVSGATQADFYLGNYAYADIVASMANLKMRLDTAGTNRLFYKDASGIVVKVMADASAGNNHAASRVLYTDANGAAQTGAALTWNGTTLGVTGGITASTTIAATGAVTGSNLNVSNWDTAYGWGDHSGLYAPLTHGASAGYIPGAASTTTWEDSPLQYSADSVQLGDNGGNAKSIIIAGPNLQQQSGNLFFADSDINLPYGNGIGITYDSLDNELQFWDNNGLSDTEFSNSILTLSRDSHDVRVHTMATGSTNAVVTRSSTGVLHQRTIDSRVWGNTLLDQAQADALYAAVSHNHAWSEITSTPTTRSGYGITDAAPLTHGVSAGYIAGASSTTALEDSPLSYDGSGDVACSGAITLNNRLILGNKTAVGAGGIDNANATSQSAADSSYFTVDPTNTDTDYYEFTGGTDGQVIFVTNISTTVTAYIDGLNGDEAAGYPGYTLMGLYNSTNADWVWTILD